MHYYLSFLQKINSISFEFVETFATIENKETKDFSSLLDDFFHMCTDNLDFTICYQFEDKWIVSIDKYPEINFFAKRYEFFLSSPTVQRTLCRLYHQCKFIKALEGIHQKFFINYKEKKEENKLFFYIFWEKGARFKIKSLQQSHIAYILDNLVSWLIKIQDMGYFIKDINLKNLQIYPRNSEYEFRVMDPEAFMMYSKESNQNQFSVILSIFLLEILDIPTEKSVLSSKSKFLLENYPDISFLLLDLLQKDPLMRPTPQQVLNLLSKIQQEKPIIEQEATLSPEISVEFGFEILKIYKEELLNQEKALALALFLLNNKKEITNSAKNFRYLLGTLGSLYEEKEDFLLAAKFYKEAYDNKEELTEADALILVEKAAHNHEMTGKLREALSFFGEAVQKQQKCFGNTKKTVDLCEKIAEISYALNDFPEAIQVSSKAIDILSSLNLSPRKNLHLLLGKAYFSVQNWEKARLFLKKEENPSPNVLNMLAIASKSLKIYEESIGFYEKILESTEHSETKLAIMQNLAEISFQKGLLDKTFEYQMKSLPLMKETYGENHLNVAILLRNLAETSFSKGKIEQAKEFYQSTIDILQENPGLFEEKAEIYEKIAEINEKMGYDSMPFWEKAIEIKENLDNCAKNAVIYNKLGCLFYEHGDNLKAKTFFEKALATNLKFNGEADENNEIYRENIRNIC